MPGDKSLVEYFDNYYKNTKEAPVSVENSSEGNSSEEEKKVSVEDSGEIKRSITESFRDPRKKQEDFSGIWRLRNGLYAEIPDVSIPGNLLHSIFGYVLVPASNKCDNLTIPTLWEANGNHFASSAYDLIRKKRAEERW